MRDSSMLCSRMNRLNRMDAGLGAARMSDQRGRPGKTSIEHMPALLNKAANVSL